MNQTTNQSDEYAFHIIENKGLRYGVFSGKYNQ